MTKQDALDKLCDLWEDISHHNTDYETLYTEEREEAYKMAESALENQFQCESKKKYITKKEFKPDCSKDCEVACAIQLDLAVEIFVKMIEELGISNQEFLAHFMYVYGLEPGDVYAMEDWECD